MSIPYQICTKYVPIKTIQDIAKSSNVDEIVRLNRHSAFERREWTRELSDDGTNYLYNVDVITLHGKVYKRSVILPVDLDDMSIDSHIYKSTMLPFKYDFELLYEFNGKPLKDLVFLNRLDKPNLSKKFKYNFITPDKINKLQDNEYYVLLHNFSLLIGSSDNNFDYNEELTEYIHNWGIQASLYFMSQGIDEIRMKEMYGS